MDIVFQVLDFKDVGLPGHILFYLVPFSYLNSKMHALLVSHLTVTLEC
jgi:hypothetical protein